MPELSLADAVLLLSLTALTVVPGLLLVVAAGLRGWTALGTAGLATYGLVGVASPLFGPGALPWGPTGLAAATLAGVVVALLAAHVAGLPRRLRRLRAGADAGAVGVHGAGATVADDRRAAPPAAAGRRALWAGLRPELPVLAGVVGGSALGAAVLVKAMGTLDAVNQDWDVVFHANAVRVILETGDGDPLALAAVNSEQDAGSYFYPNGFHALSAVAAAVGSPRLSAVMGAQAVLVVVLAALSLAAMIRVWGGRPALAATTAFLVATFSGFPYDLLWRGPLLPYAVGLALLPAFLLTVRAAVRRPGPGTVLVCAVSAVGLLALQPSLAFVAVPFVLAMLVDRAARVGRAVWRDVAVLVAVALLSAVLGARHVLGALGSAESTEIDWPAVMSPGQAVGDLLLLNHGRVAPQWSLVVLLLVGALAVRGVRRLWWWLAASGVFAALFVVAAAYEGDWVVTLTKPFWNDRWRFVAVVVLALVVLAAQGVVTLGDRVAGLAGRLGPARLSRVAGPLGTVLVLAVFAGTSGLYASDNAQRTSRAYTDGPTVSEAEEAAFARLAEIVPDGARVMNDPNDGSPWMWSLEDVRPVYGHNVPPGSFRNLGEDRETLVLRFNELDDDPQVRALVDAYDIEYVFLGTGYVRPDFTRAEGLERLGALDSVELVESVQGNLIYRVLPAG